MQPQPTPDLPFLPTWKNLKIFLLGLLWCCVLASGPFLYEVWDAAHNYDKIDWTHIEIETSLVFGPAAGAYWRKYKALIAPVPLEGDERKLTFASSSAIVPTPVGQPDMRVETKTTTLKETHTEPVQELPE